MLIFDIGGTYIKYAIIKSGEIVYKNKVATPHSSLITNTLSNIATKLSAKYHISEIGISSAGQINSKLGKVIYAGNTMPGYSGTELKQEVQMATKLNVSVINDVEACMYNYIDANDLLYIAIGTGIGGGYIHNNQVHTGDNGFSMEIGHMYHQRGDEFENICSTKSLLYKYYQKSGNNVSGEELDQLFNSNDRLAQEIVEEYLYDLALGIININYILDCNHVILGGGIAEATFFCPYKIQEYIQELNLARGKPTLKIEKSTYGNDAPLYGVYKYLKILKNN